MAQDLLVADHAIEYTYTRSTGSVIGAFMTALRDRKVLGVRASDGRVVVPPVDYDPVTADALSELVEVADTGIVTTYAWNADPVDGQPLDRPFAWVLVKLDGADTGMLGAVDCATPDAIRSGVRVRVRWPDEPTGTIRDAAVFEATP